jgi:hypothetical protein
MGRQPIDAVSAILGPEMDCSREIFKSFFFDYLVQNLFPSNFSGTCDIEEERKSSFCFV